MGGTRYRSAITRSAAVIAVATATLACATGAGAATQIGTTFPGANAECGANITVLQSGSGSSSYAAPAPGVITSWSFRAMAAVPDAIKFKVGRSAGGNLFSIVGESGQKIPVANALNTYTDIRIPVQAGDVIGYAVFGTTMAFCGKSGAGMSFLAHDYFGDALPGTGPVDFGPDPPYNGVQYDFSALLEADCDGDGLGDETQDQDVVSCPPGPITTITKGPADKVKTKKNRTTATFTFTADEPDAAFDCALDGKQEFEPCVSPLTVTVRRGKHSFTIQATDAGGNQGPAVTDTWKVKRKKPKK